jgi:hypothetical protein
MGRGKGPARGLIVPTGRDYILTAIAPDQLRPGMSQ